VIGDDDISGRVRRDSWIPGVTPGYRALMTASASTPPGASASTKIGTDDGAIPANMLENTRPNAIAGLGKARRTGEEVRSSDVSAKPQQAHGPKRNFRDGYAAGVSVHDPSSSLDVDATRQEGCSVEFLRTPLLGYDNTFTYERLADDIKGA